MIPDAWLEALSQAVALTPKQLEKRFGAEASRWALLQVELRKKARAKFADADSMLFEREALEQATHEEVAKYHASRFPEGASVVDITTGIGSDLCAFPNAIGFELDPSRAQYAQQNSGKEVRVGDGLEFVRENPVDYIWADPDRRDAGGKRLADPSQFQPNPLEIPRDRQLTGIKLSPLLQDEFLESVGERIEFVSYKGECREAIAWSGKLISPLLVEGVGEFAKPSEPGGTDFAAGTYAIRIQDSVSSITHPVVSQGEIENSSFVERNATPPSRRGLSPGRLVLARSEIYDVETDPGEYIFDADPAAVRAHALGNFNLPQLGDSPGYLTGDFLDSEWLTPYQVIASGSFDTKRIKEALRTHGLRVFEVKQRGAGVDPTTVMKQVKMEGEPVSLICWKVEKSIRFALARR